MNDSDKELKVFPKLQFISRFNQNVSLFVLPYVIIKMIIYSNSEITQQIYEEIMSVIQLNQYNNTSSSNNSFNTTSTMSPSPLVLQNNTTTTTTSNIIQNNNSTASKSSFFNNTTALNNNNNDKSASTNSTSNSKMIFQYHHICCQTVFNIYDHLVRQLNHYRSKMTELQSVLKIRSNNSSNIMLHTKSNGSGSGSSSSGSSSTSRQTANSLGDKQSSNEMLYVKYRELFELFQKFVQHIPHQALSKAAFECKAYCRSLMHYELHMRNTPGAVQIQGSTINIKQEHLIELQNLYASMDEIDAASGKPIQILVLLL
jgi:hypothetical protein